MNAKEVFVENYLKMKNRFVLSSELIYAITKTFPMVSNSYARKIISNLNKKGIITSSCPITFSNNNFAYATKNKKVNYKNLEELIKKEKKQLYRAICLIKREKNILTYNELVKVAGCPISSVGKNVIVDDIISELLYFGIVQMAEYNGITFFISKKMSNVDLDKKILNLEKENKVLVILINWLKESNIINSDDIVTFKGEKNYYKGIDDSGLLWDAFFYTKTVGLGSKTDDKKTIGVIDFLYASKYDWLDIEGFKSRVDILINSTKKENSNRKVLPIILADEITNAAKKIIKENNYICIDIKRIIGNNYEKIVSKYLELRKNDIYDIKEIDKICNLIGENANYGNMKGTLFEYIIGDVLRKIYIESGVNFEHAISINGREIDYRIETPKENIFFELKSYKKDCEIELGDESQKYTVNWSYKGTYKMFVDKYKNDPNNRKCKFCYITTSKFDTQAIEMLKKLNKGKCKPDKMDCYYDRDKLLDLLKEKDCKNEIRIIKNYY